MRSARFGKRLIAGVQKSAKFAGIDDVLEPRLAALEQHDDLELAAGVAPKRRREAVEVDEQEALREREILLQQPIALEPAQRRGQQRLVVLEACPAYAFRPEQQCVPAPWTLGRSPRARRAPRRERARTA